MTKLTRQQPCHHNYIIPISVPQQHELWSCRQFSVAHRSVSPPCEKKEGYARLPIGSRPSAEPSVDDEAAAFLRPPQHHPPAVVVHEDHEVLDLDLDRMSDHDPSSGDGEEEPPSPEPAPYPPKSQQWKPPATGFRPPHQAPLKNTTANPNYTTSKAISSQSHDARQIPGQSVTYLPTEKVFPVQVGTEIFRLSGASISSDGPSYFTQFFEDQIRQNEETGGVRTLYIDRDPETFRDIARHLQGYYVKPRDGPHFVRLFADAQFYSLPRLISQLFESEIFIQIGEQHFQIPKDIFSEPGNSPNFFSLGFAVFFSTPQEVFPGLDRRGLLRPPPINPPYVPTRSAEIFSQILHLLRGYPLNIRNETHRQELLRDCRYFHLRGLEQRIIAHDISYNVERQRSEICLSLNDLKPSGVSYRPDDASADSSASSTSSVSSPETGWVHYARPFVDEQSYELIVEINSESTVLDLDEMRVDFHGKTKARVSSLFQVVANKMNLPSNQPLGLIMLSGGTSKRSPSPGHSSLSEDKVRVRFETATDIALDNKPLDLDWDGDMGRHMRAGAPLTLTTQASKRPPTHAPVDPDDYDPNDFDDPVSSTSSSAPQPPSTTSQRTASQSQKSKSQQQQHQPPQKKRKVDLVATTTAGPASGGGGSARFGRWVIRNAQYRVRVEQSTNAARGKYEIVFVAVKVDAFTGERARNARRGFLT